MEGMDTEAADPVALTFPLARVKKIMKADKDVATIQNDALLATTACAEVFLEFLTQEVSKSSTLEKRKTINYKDVANSVAKDPRLQFLSELIPKPVSLSEALSYQKLKKAELAEDTLGGGDPAKVALDGDDPIEDDLVEEDPVEDDLVEEDPVEDDLVEEDPVEDDLVEEDPVEDDLVEEDPVEDTIIEDDYQVLRGNIIGSGNHIDGDFNE